jgi:hypothetical protein
MDSVEYSKVLDADGWRAGGPRRRHGRCDQSQGATSGTRGSEVAPAVGPRLPSQRCPHVLGGRRCSGVLESDQEAAIHSLEVVHRIPGNVRVTVHQATDSGTDEPSLFF